MIQHLLLRYSVFMVILLVQACGCGGNPEAPTKKLNPLPKPDTKPDSKPDLGSGDPPASDGTVASWDLTGNIYKASAWIKPDDSWLDALGIEKGKSQTVVVNASNSHIKSAGGGIDGALGKWVESKKDGRKPWTNPAPTMPNGQAAPNQLEAGKFALFQVPFGYIYLAVGPQASNVKTLSKAKALIADLYYQILLQAKKDDMKCVVLCAISTAIFAHNGTEADTGKHFTKEEFITSAYKGMEEGIAKFQQENPKHALKIILNNWSKRVVNQVKALIK